MANKRKSCKSPLSSGTYESRKKFVESYIEV